LHKSAPNPRTRRSRIDGFSLVELAVSMCVVLILSAMAIPSLMHSVRTYQLNDTAGRLSDILKFTRFEAVRRNSLEYFRLNQAGAVSVIWTSPSSSNTNPLVTEKQILLAGFATLVPGTASGLPGQAAICNKLVNNSGPCMDDTLSGSSGTVTFDARGAIRVGGSVANRIFVFYIGSPASPEFGYRAVVQLPSGSTQIWTASSGGTWQQTG
jgi:type II secretory pathway pseudopilin PulG